MIKPYNFKTKSFTTLRNDYSASDVRIIALDIGYSSVKGMSADSAYMFPSYAKKIPDLAYDFSKAKNTDITYRDDITGEIWDVGEKAGLQVSSLETNDSLEDLYGRNRYFSPMYRVISDCGIALGLKGKYKEGQKIIIQTGLPSAYKSNDAELIKEALGGQHKFSIKVGMGEWLSYSLDIDEEDILVMEQPLGTLVSISTDREGKVIPEARNYFDSKLLIVDIGFGTLDTFDIARGRLAASPITYDNLAMKRVFLETTKKIRKEYGEEISLPALQNCLLTGEFSKKDRKTLTLKKINFTDMLEESSRKVCEEAIKKIEQINNYLFDYSYLVLTGGTGDAWFEMFYNHFKGNEELKILKGNSTDKTLPTTMANVRGYYLNAKNSMKG